MIKEYAKQVVPNAVAHHPLADAQPSHWPTPPFFCSAYPFLFCPEHTHSNFTSQALEVFLWRRFKLSKCDTEVCCFVGLFIKPTRSCREPQPDTGGSRGGSQATLTWPRLRAEGTGRRTPGSCRSLFGQSFPTCTDQRLQHHGNKGSLSLNCHSTRSQQQGTNPEYFCRIKRKQTLLKPLRSPSCQRHFISVIVKAHQVIWFEKHHISTFWLSNTHFSKVIIFMHADTLKGKIRTNNTSYPSPISSIIRMVIFNPKCNFHFSQR